MLKLFLFIIIGLIISYIIANEFFAIATRKGYNSSKYFWYCFLFGIAGYLMVVALPKKENKQPESTSTHNQDYGKSVEAINMEIADMHKEDSIAFTTTPQNTIVCSACNFEQSSGRKVCWKCGRHFSD